MHLDVLDLRNFYYHTSLGRVAQRAIRDCVQTAWTPEQVRGQTVAGYGFAVPLLRPYLGTARRVIGLMPGPQGVMPWPAGRPNVSVLCEETLWPLETGHVDRLLLMHGLETSERPTSVLDEAQRVLGPGGRAMFVVPNRAGLWARGDGTPYGFGRPYSLGQLEDQLRRHDFVPERHFAALFSPPSSRRFWLKSADVWERVGRRLSTFLAGGVFMVEASKRNPPQRRASDRVALRILDSVTAPAAEPA